MNIIEKKLAQIKALEQLSDTCENALKSVKTAISDASTTLDTLPDGKTQNAVKKQYKKRLELALKALNGQTRVINKGGNE